MYSIFRDPELRAQIDRDGYVKLPMLDEAALEELRELFGEVRRQMDLKGFATTTTSPDIAFKQDLFSRIAPLYQARLDELFQKYRSLGVSFLQKDAGTEGNIPLHQDWTVTDEYHFRTFTIWVPLEDCGLENGALQMIPGSHQWMNLLRGPNLPIAITDIAEALRPWLVTVPLKAGEGIVFDHAILHTSTLNSSGRPRVAITYGLRDQDAPLRFWYHHPGDLPDRFEQLSVPEDFFMRYHQIGQRPGFGKSLGFYRQDLSAIALSELESVLKLGQEYGYGSILFDRRPILRDLSDKRPVLDVAQAEITQDSEWNRTLALQGFVTFPLLGPEQIGQLTSLFLKHSSGPIDRFYASVHHPDPQVRRDIDAGIQAILRALLAGILDQGEALGASFIAKPKGNPGILPPHADWNIADERFYRSYNLWIPLVDTTVANGAVHVIPGSHRWMDYYRGPGIPNPFEPWKEAVWETMQPLELKAGTALLYDHRLLHASPVNQRDELRLACVVGVKHREAGILFYCGRGGMIHHYAADAEFFLTGNPEEGHGELVYWGEVAAANPDITAEDLERFLGVKGEVAVEGGQVQPARGFWETYTLRNMWQEFWWRVNGKK
jgi:ectoine hydroxylase-related dioxygenase (phytanoyl-CoA dioxygenase family)